MHRTILTFDVEGPPGREDFLTQEEIGILTRLLRLLEKYQLEALFFIPGTIAEKLVSYPQVLDLLRAHEIGYHSSSHSVEPRIFEYTDVKSYEKAFQISLERETSSINPFNGKIKGEGGIKKLREIFPGKDIVSFRAPFWCFSPPHIEALRELGIKNDFSDTKIFHLPFSYKGLIFFPKSNLIDGFQGNLIFAKQNFSRGASNEIAVLLMHPSMILVKPNESLYARYSDAFHPFQIKIRIPVKIEYTFASIELRFFFLSLLQKAGLTEVDPSVNDRYLSPGPTWKLDGKSVDIEKIYRKTMWAPLKIFGYYPKYLKSHFYRFFER